MTALTRSPVTAAVIAVLTSGTGKAVGDGRPPPPAAGAVSPLPPYYIVYELPSAFIAVGLDGERDFGNLLYQVTSVGRTRDDASDAADAARAALTTGAVATALGAAVAECASDGPGHAAREGDLFNAPETYTVAVPRTA